MNVFTRLVHAIFPPQSARPLPTLSKRHTEARKLTRALHYAGLNQQRKPTAFLKRRHLTAVTTFEVSPIAARMPQSLIMGQLAHLGPWWSQEVVTRSVDKSALTKDSRVPGTNTFLITIEKRQVRLLDGKDITTVREVYYDSDDARHFKKLYVKDDRGELIDYNRIPKHLMPLDGIDDVDIRADRDILVVEGYPAAETLRKRKQNAVGIMSGTFDVPSERALAPLLQAKTIYLWPDNDSAGVTLMDSVARQLNRMGARKEQIKVIRWIAGPRKGDAYDFPDDPQLLAELINKARPWRSDIRTATNSVLRLTPARSSPHLRLSNKIQPPRPTLHPVKTPERGPNDIQRRLTEIARAVTANTTVSDDDVHFLRNLLEEYESRTDR